MLKVVWKGIFRRWTCGIEGGKFPFLTTVWKGPGGQAAVFLSQSRNFCLHRKESDPRGA